MATLATQPVTTAGCDLAHANAQTGGDRFTPDADVLLHVVNTGTGSVTVTVPAQAPVAGSHVADLTLTVTAGGSAFCGPFPASVFADPATGFAVLTYSDAAHTQVAAVGFSRSAQTRGTIVTRSNAVPVDLPSGQVWATDTGDLYLTPSSGAPAVGAAVTVGTTDPTDLPDGTLYIKTVSGIPTDLYLTPGVSAAQIMQAASAPADLAAGQILVVTGPTGTPTDLYIGA